MSVVANESVDVVTREDDAVAALHLLNADFVQALAESDTAWYEAHLRDDFVCTLADGQRLSKEAFVESTAVQLPVRRICCEEVDVRVLGDVALVHGVVHYPCDGAVEILRYTAAWQSRREVWQAVAAHFTRVDRARAT